MPENINPTQQPQNFAPIKKPNFWHRALFWLSGLTPKHKAVLAVVLVLAAAVISVLIYFVFAKNQFTFEMSPASGSFVAGNPGQVELLFETDDDNSRTAKVHAVISYDQSLIRDVLVNPGESSLNPLTVTYEPGKIIIDGSCSSSTCNADGLGGYSLGNDQRLQFAVIAFNVISGVSGNLVFGLSGASVKGLDANSQPTIDIPIQNPNQSWTYQIISVGNEAVYLKPASQEFLLGNTYQVEIWARSMDKDIVAAEIHIKYDPVYFKIDVIDSPVFPVTGLEGTLDQAGMRTYTLVRGTYGDGVANNGDISPNISQKGFKGENIFATLDIQTLEVSDPNFIPIEITYAAFVLDDQNGTLETNVDKSSGSYKIVEEPPFVAGIIITKGPEVHVQKDVNGIWNAEIYWETNVDANAQVIYDQQASDGSFNLDGSASLEPAVPGAVLSKQHQITLTGLTEGATYRYQVISQDSNHNEVRDKNLVLTNDSRHHQFIVKEELANLTIKNLSAKASYNSAIISWNTVGGNSDGLARAEISCTGGNPDNPVVVSYSLSHSIAVSGLNNNTPYSCTVKSTNIGKINNESAVCTTENPCTVTFKTKLGQDFDANVVLKVMPDRICDKWLYCRSAVEVVNNKDEKESLCFDVGLCNEQNSDGECVSITDLSALGITASEQTFKHPVNVSQIQNLSGYSKVGMDWDNGKIIMGNYNVGVMEPIGADINLVNGDFETGESWPWKSVSNAELSVIYKNDSRVLKIKPQVPTGANQWLSAEVPLGFISREPGYDYAISMSIWSAGSVARDVDVELKVGSAYYTVAKVTINNAPQTIVLTSNQKNSQFAYGAQSGPGALAIGDRYEPIKSGYFSDDIYLDNISLKSVLPINSLEKISRSCRLYPSVGAVACDTVDANGKVQRGWRGFCLEQDIKYQSSDQEKKMCLNWWPVDIIPGETDVFGKDNQAGYLGRQPLYYCVEAAGNYPYKRTTRDNDPSLRFKGPLPLEMGWSRVSYLETKMAAGETGLREIDIERIVLEPLCEESGSDSGCFSKKANAEAYLTLNRSNKWQGYMCIGSLCRSDFNWDNDIVPNVINDQKCEKMAFDLFALRAVFDEQGNFKGLENGLCNWGPSGYVRYRSIFYLRESCNVVAQVVTPDGENMAWASKVKRGGWLKDSSDNYLGYEYGTDYEPYGAAVVGAPSSDPTEWFNPLYVMPLDDALGYEAPYQVRAGTPYGVEGSAGLEKIGKAQCISGEAENLGSVCSSSSDCGFSLDSGRTGLCMGVNLSEKAVTNIYGGYDSGEKNLQNLFAKSYRVWKWAKKTDGTLGYIEVGQSVGLAQNFGWDISPEASIDTKPTIFNVKVKGQSSGEVSIVGPKRVKLEFNSKVNADHLPLTAFRVDWGDATPVSQVNNLKIEARNIPSTPHVLFHTYEVHKPSDPYPGGGIYATHGCTTTDCTYVPKIQVEDNWGWCNNGVAGDKCPEDKNSWQGFGVRVIVN